MTTTTTMDETIETPVKNPGAQLAEIRKQKGLSKEYVAGKLHLRLRIIELIEADDYPNMPEPVFIKGYLRAYAKLLGTDSQPLLNIYNNSHGFERKTEKALWQSRKESNKASKAVRWFTLLFAVAVFVAIGVWWHQNKDTPQLYNAAMTQNDLGLNKAGVEIRLTDLSRMKSLLSPNAQMTLVEKNGG